MKYLRQLLMILIFSFIGEVLHAVIPIQMPASIYGLVLLFIALMTGLVKLPQVHEAARFLIEIMPLMFIPAGVGLIDSWGELRPILLPVPNSGKQAFLPLLFPLPDMPAGILYTGSG